MSVSLPSEKCLEIQPLSHSLLQRQPVIVLDSLSLLDKGTFVPMGMHSSASHVVSFR